MQNPSSLPILLASASNYRRGLLERFLHDFQSVDPDIDESAVEFAKPEDLAPLLARKKAEAVSSSQREALIIGADQLAILDQQILGKPGNHNKAIEQLLAASGKSLHFHTAVCVLDPVGRHRYEHVDRTVVRFRQFDRRLEEAYLRHDQPYDCAGSFKI